MHRYLYRALLLVVLSIIIVNSTHRPIRRQSGLVPLTLLLKPRLPPHTGCGRHSTTANVGMPLAATKSPNPLSSRQLKVPQGASTGATTPCERHGSMAAVEPLVVRIGTEQCNARNAAHCTVRASQLLNRGIVVSGD